MEMKQQIILWLSRISVFAIVAILGFAVSFIIALMFDTGLSSSNDVTEGAHFVSCLMFALAFCLWLYG